MTVDDLAGMTLGDGARCQRTAGWARRSAASPTAPRWLADVLVDAAITVTEPSRGEWVRTAAPICWPRVVAEHGARCAVGGEVEVVGGVEWRAVCLAFALLDCHGFGPRLDVRVWLAERDQVVLEPVALFADGGRVSDELAVAVDDVLARGGRSRLALHWDADEDSWALTD
ncbi:hypothetical protein [Nocardia camponoti]|uniref:Uncharacterized protein n=1 Tax=Nocardia camponoti TaxID=1616106 RepID=A0A917QUH7_9NOCA|nr:hypothetical protein [Nocardia camponoti]GGK69029.1 hypothetical protein GCM10011591_46430 [Nocardia camponoti]